MLNLKNLFKKKTQQELNHQLADKANRERFENVIDTIRKAAESGQYRLMDIDVAMTEMDSFNRFFSSMGFNVQTQTFVPEKKIYKVIILW